MLEFLWGRCLLGTGGNIPPEHIHPPDKNVWQARSLPQMALKMNSFNYLYENSNYFVNRDYKRDLNDYFDVDYR